MIKDLQGTGNVEYNNLNQVVSLQDAIGKENMYFCAGFHKEVSGRCGDKDFTKKKYFFVDIDIRMSVYEREGRVVDDHEMYLIHHEILAKLDQTSRGCYKYVVNSGNGIHLYYVGDEIEIDYKTYAEGVGFIYETLDAYIYPYQCDPACKNIARIARLPGSINPRKKIKKDQVLRDLEPVKCEIIQTRDQIFNMDKIKIFADKKKDYDKKKQDEYKYIQQVISTTKKDNKIFDEINLIPAREIAEKAWGVQYRKVDRETHPFREPQAKKNMGAFYVPSMNIVINTGSSLINTTSIKGFSTYSLAKNEMFGGDAKRTIEYFKEHYNIHVEQPGSIPVQKEYTNLGYVYGNDAFNQFECMLSGELVIVCAGTNSGKTTFAMNMLQENKKLGKKGFYINLEFDIKTVAKNRRLTANNKTKINLSDLNPLTEQEQKSLHMYIEDYISRFDYYNKPGGEDLYELIELIKQKEEKGIKLFVIDSLSKISNKITNDVQRDNETMKKLQSLCQSLGIVIMILHHTNKNGVMSGTQKIADDSNVFINITRSGNMTNFSLTKDKYITNTEINCVYFKNEYIPA